MNRKAPLVLLLVLVRGLYTQGGLCHDPKACFVQYIRLASEATPRMFLHNKA